MHDLKAIRDNPGTFDAGLRRRGLDPLSPKVLAMDAERRAEMARSQDLQAERNKLSKEIGGLKAKGQDATELLAKVAASKDEQAKAEAVAGEKGRELDDFLATIPNLPAADVPEGRDEHANVEIRKWGEPTAFAFKAKEHFEIGEALGQMNFDVAAKMSGARFVVLFDGIARLERALASFMIDLHTRDHAYREVLPPYLVRDTALYGTGQLPKFGDDLFKTATDHWLIPTAEVPLTNLVSGDILDEETLPRRYTALTPCFRAEAGAAGRDTRGMIRQHQFEKVELVSIVHPDKSEEEHERMTACAEEILKRLKLPYRVVTLCTGDMGFSARKTYDIEVWLPGQGRYREISSCSNCGDFQARRMNARFKGKSEKGTRFVHTLNGSALAVGRTLIAVLENYQEADGSVRVPDALKPYMGGMETIARAP
jgi:seryl-tRNA synthetase